MSWVYFCGLLLPDPLEDLWVPAHPQVVVTAPDRHSRTLSPGDGIILRKREDLSTSVYCLEDAVGVVALLLGDLLVEEGVIVITGAHC